MDEGGDQRSSSHGELASTRLTFGAQRDHTGNVDLRGNEETRNGESWKNDGNRKLGLSLLLARPRLYAGGAVAPGEGFELIQVDIEVAKLHMRVAMSSLKTFSENERRTMCGKAAAEATRAQRTVRDFIVC